MALDRVKAYRNVRESLFELVAEIDHGESLYSDEGIGTIRAITDDLLSACEQYNQAVQDEEDAE